MKLAGFLHRFIIKYNLKLIQVINSSDTDNLLEKHTVSLDIQIKNHTPNTPYYMKIHLIMFGKLLKYSEIKYKHFLGSNIQINRICS